MLWKKILPLLMMSLMTPFVFADVAQSDLSDILDSSDELRGSFEERQLELFSRLEKIEKYLDSEREQLNREDLKPNSLAQRIYQTLSGLSESELAFFLEGNLDQIKNTQARESANQALKQISEFNEAHSAYQKHLDDYTRLELDYFIEGAHVAMLALRNEIAENTEIKEKDLKKIDLLLTSATSEYRRYMRYRKEIGDPRDGPNRTDAYRSFFTVAKEYFDLANKVSKETQVKLRFWTQLRIKARTIFNFTRTIIKLAPSMIKIALNAILGRPTTNERSPLVHSIDETFRKIGRITGHSVKIEGAEYLPSQRTSDKTVYIIAPTHRDPIRDGIIMANLGISNYLLTMATDQMMPKYLADKFTQNNNIVTVGRGSDTPILKILEELRRGKTNTILIYPEGSVSAGLYETRPVREKFSWGLIEALQKEGYEIKLIPVTYKNSGQFVHRNTVAGFFKFLDNSTASRELQVAVSRPLDSKFLKLIARATEATAIGRFIRATWMDGLPHDSEFHSGLMRIEAAAKEFKEELGIFLLPKTVQCRSLFKD